MSLEERDSGHENPALELAECEGNPETTVIQEEKHAQHAPFQKWKKAAEPFSKTRRFYKSHASVLHKIFLGVLGAAYLAYFIAACVLDFQRALALVVLTCLAVFLGLYTLVKKLCGATIARALSPVGKCFQKSWFWLKWVLCVVILIGLITWLVLDISQRREQLVSLAGFCTLALMLFVCSKHHRAVSWRAVFWGLGLQFLLGVFIVRTDPGFQAFQWLGEQVQIFLNYTTAGSRFVFGDQLIQNVFAFQALPIIVFFSSVMSVLYYLGVMQWIILKLSWILQITMGTAATESLSVVGNVFVGMTEAPLLIRPYLLDMTKSEVHAVMTGGFATIAGSVLGAYISFGIDASSLIAASVMAAPCALAMAKLIYPEVEESKFRSREGVKIACGEEQNILEAISNGAAVSVGLVANIAVNLIAFLAVLEFINATLAWLGNLVNITGLSFQLICSYVLMPLAFLLGASWEDAGLVAEMLGVKFFLNEFVAYQQLSTYKQRRMDGRPEWDGANKQWISVRAETITTFALCGFANLSSIGIMLGGLSSLAPQRKSEFSSIVVRALLTGACVSLMNACIAGILYVPRGEVTDCLSFFNATDLSSTSYPVYVCCTDLFGSTTGMNGPFTGAWGHQDILITRMYLQQCCSHYNVTVCTKP
ncbi:sodium/nucleoside cotransporter 2-like [Sphaerodactylus townsendi]|uniref:sodium/nucleoside cotransporter 2-like n=1 Tax=Sphaerodactylus townsendi TaxID=933632 RepID=UPI002027302F|nr:sodium/nucleoside cotransporter 2-like [Sphaerodactylus townsendi]